VPDGDDDDDGKNFLALFIHHRKASRVGFSFSSEEILYFHDDVDGSWMMNDDI
jgi:hypothetical protein